MMYTIPPMYTTQKGQKGVYTDLYTILGLLFDIAWNCGISTIGKYPRVSRIWHFMALHESVGRASCLSASSRNSLLNFSRLFFLFSRFYNSYNSPNIQSIPNHYGSIVISDRIERYRRRNTKKQSSLPYETLYLNTIFATTLY